MKGPTTDCPETIEKLKARLDVLEELIGAYALDDDERSFLSATEQTLKRGAAMSRLGVSRMDRIRAKVFRRVLSHKSRVVRR